MKRIGVIVALVLLVAVVLAIVLPSATSYRNPPRYVPGRAQPTGNYTSTHYDWLKARPFVNDRVWVFGTRDRTKGFSCLYDLRERMILGELLNAGVELANADGTKLLVIGRDSPAVNFKSRLLKLLRRISGGKITVNNDRTESFWVLNLQDNSTKRVGAVTQFEGAGSRWYTSPSLRYGCTMPTAEFNQAFVLFDFATDRFTRIPFDGQLCAWWDDQNVLLRANNNDLVLYDVGKMQTTVLFSAETIRQTLEQLKLPSDPAQVATFANWNSREYDIYFAEKDYEFRAKRCFLLKADRASPQPALKLISPEFKFEWGGHLDASATHFLFQGELGGSGVRGNGAVYLRDLSDNSVRTLVPPDNKGQYAIPRFYGDEVIYYRNRVLWRIGLDGSNNVPLFPTTNSPASP
jgi:hypothetical protein